VAPAALDLNPVMMAIMVSVIAHGCCDDFHLSRCTQRDAHARLICFGHRPSRSRISFPRLPRLRASPPHPPRLLLLPRRGEKAKGARRRKRLLW
jgi:hypothetical protein